MKRPIPATVPAEKHRMLVRLILLSCFILPASACRKSVPQVGESAETSTGGLPAGSAAERNLAAGAKFKAAIKARQSRQHDEARALLLDARALNPSQPGVDFQLAILEFDLGKDDEAESLARASIKSGDSVPQSWNLLGTIATRRGDYPAADEAFSAGLETEPADGLLLYNWSEALRSQGRIDEAIKKLRQASEANPGETLYALKLRIARVENGEEEALISEISQALSQKDPAPDWIITAAAVALHRGQYREAAYLLASAGKKMQPGFLVAMMNEDAFFRRYRDRPELAIFFADQQNPNQSRSTEP